VSKFNLGEKIVMEKDKKNKFSSGQKQQSFEDALQRLEDIVNKLESEEVPLEETISLFEEGQELINFCNKKLEEVKHKVEIVLKTKNGFDIKPFSEEENDEEDLDNK
jgi:exodeoxyribonuclease VII small subunit